MYESMSYRVDQAEYGIHILMIAPQEYVNIDSTRRHTPQNVYPPWASLYIYIDIDRYI